MQLVQTGRNEPCPCGSGRKYKKCCLSAPNAAAVSAPGDLDVAALVDQAIADGDWRPVHEVFDQGFPLFEPGSPLEHVRFRDQQLVARWPDAGWLRYCEQEIGYVLDRYELSDAQRNSLRLMTHLVRRFGAKSPVAESVGELQAAEYRVRAHRFSDALTRYGFTVQEAGTGWDDLFAWIERERPSVLLFADWFAMRSRIEAEIEVLWSSGIAMRVCDFCLARLEPPDVPDALQWLRLAAIALFGGMPPIGYELVRLTAPRHRTDDERLVYTMFATAQVDERFPAALNRIVEAIHAGDDFAGAALLRGALHSLRARQRR